MVQADELEPSLRLSRPPVAICWGQGWFFTNYRLSVRFSAYNFILVSKTFRYFVLFSIVLIDADTAGNRVAVGTGFQVEKALRSFSAQLESLNHTRRKDLTITLALALIEIKITITHRSTARLIAHFLPPITINIKQCYFRMCFPN